MRLRNDAALFNRCDFGFVGDGRAHFFGFAHTIRPSLHNATKIQSQCATREDCLCATRTTCDFCPPKPHVIPQSQDVQTADSTCADTEGKLRGHQQQDSQSRRGCRVYFSHGRIVFTPVPKFVRERVLRYGRRSATDNVSLRANTVEHPLDWGDNAQRTADSAS